MEPARVNALAACVAVAALDVALPWATCGGVWPTDALGSALAWVVLGGVGVAALPAELAAGLVVGAWSGVAAWLAWDEPGLAEIFGVAGLAAGAAWARWAPRGALGLASGALAVVLVAVAVDGGRPSAPMVTAGPGGPDVLLVVVDTLRADAAAGMTSFQRVAAEGADLGPAHTPSTWTAPAMASLLTGRSDHAVGRRDGATTRLSSSVPTLAEALASAGWDTVAVTTNPHCGSAVGLDRGFAWFDHDGAASLAGCALPWRGASRPLVVQVGLRVGDEVGWLATLLRAEDRVGPEPQVDRLLAALAVERDRPVFAWLHLMGPHLPYSAGPAGGMPRTELLGADEALRAEVRAAYAAEVARTDRALVRLLDSLPASPRGRIVILTSDHGEELWEHGGFEHGHAFWEEVVGVPLVVSGIPTSPRSVSSPASLLDVAPTVLRAAGLPEDLPGTPLQEAAEDRVLTVRGRLYGDPGGYARRWGAEKVIVDGEARAYDLLEDPGEQRGRLVEGIGAAGAVAGEAADFTVEEREVLRALGYAGP